MSASLFTNLPEELRLNVEYIKSRCYYWPISGDVIYKPQDFGLNPTPRQKQWNTRFANKKAGHLNDNGYLRVSFGPSIQEFYVHQIAFAVMADYIPLEIDHNDKNKLNNAWENLRDAAHFENASNVFKRANNIAGIKGVSWSKSNNCWRMDIQSRGIKYFSYHETQELAYKAYCAKSTELHKEFGCAD